MGEYQQQWSSLTAQVDVLEQMAFLCEREASGSHHSAPSFASLPRSASLPSGALPTSASYDPSASTNGSSRSTKPRPPRQRTRPSSQASEQPHEKECSTVPETETLRRERSSGSPRPHRRSPSPSKAGDEIDQMWCRALRRYPEREDWVLVKERPGVYRLGHPGGRAVHSRVTHAGLQVRVGGGWMNAEAFLRRIGNAAIPPAGMTAAEFVSGYGVDRGKPRSSGSATLPTGRILSPTKSWASRIGMPKSPDFRSQRSKIEATSDDDVAEGREGACTDEQPGRGETCVTERTRPSLS